MSKGGGDSTSLDGKEDIFDEVIDKLTSANKAVQRLVSPIEEATTVVSDVTGVLDDVKSFESALNDINYVLKILTEILPSLTEIPVVGEILDAFDSVLTTITDTLSTFLHEFNAVKEDIIDPVDKILTDIESGLSKTKTVLIDLFQKLPEFLNTIQILSYLARIVIPLSKILEGTEVADRLGKIISELGTVNEAVKKALSPITVVFEAIESAAKFIGEKLKGFFDAIGNSVKNALEGFRSAGHVLDSIKDVFDKILDAIKPVKWALDAIRKIFDKVVKPVINKILEMTGLKQLIDTVSSSVLDQLHVSDLLDSLKKDLGVSAIESATSAVEQAAGQKLANNAALLFQSLGKYKSHGDNDSPVSEVVVNELLSTITGASVDDSGVYDIPPFPNIPGFSDGGTGPSETFATAAMAARFPSTAAPVAIVSPTPRYSSLRNRNLQNLFAKVGSVGSIPPPSPSVLTTLISTGSSPMMMKMPSGESAPALPEPSVLTIVDPKTWPQCSQALNTIDVLVEDVKEFSPTVKGLANSLEAFKSALQLSDTFKEQMTDLDTIFGTVDDLMNLLIKFEVSWITIIISPVEDVVKNQRMAAQYANSSVSNLTQAVKDVSEAAQSVTDAMTGDVAKSNVLLNGKLELQLGGWSLGIRQLVAMVQEGRKQDPSASCDGTTYGKKLDERAAALESSASELNTRLSSIDQLLKEVSGSVKQMMDDLSSFSTQLKVIASYSDVIGSKALPTVHQAAHILGIIDSVIDPLTSLLKEQHCVRSDAKSDAWNTCQTLVNDGSKAFLQSTYAPDVFEKVAEEIADKVLPLGILKTNVESAVKILSDDVQKTFENKSSELLSNFNSLMKSLETTRSYTIQRNIEGQPPVKEIVHNDFVTDQDVEDAKKLACRPSDSHRL